MNGLIRIQGLEVGEGAGAWFVYLRRLSEETSGGFEKVFTILV